MTCGEESKSYQTWRYLVLSEMSFGTASGHYLAGVELLNETWGLTAYRPQSNSEYREDYPGSESAGANVGGQKGNNPDRQLRSLSRAKCIRKFVFRDSQDVGLEAATI
jgi:hypothetical protein